ncbi:MAG: TetR family transcriptional regulator [Anaerolineae bacterium]
MKKTEVKRQLILGKIAEYLLAYGMRDASLRQLAAKIGTSDRMLLHYFSDKNELMNAALNLVAAQLIDILDSTRSKQMPFETLMTYLAGMIKEPDIRPYLRLWLELAAMSTASEAYRTIARQICDSFYDWINSVLIVEKDEERAPMAALAFATIEGFVLLDSLGYDAKITSALKRINAR